MDRSNATIYPDIASYGAALAEWQDKQLERVYARLYYRIGAGGMFGWDWPTLRTENPGLYNSMRAVCIEMDRRANALQPSGE